jgi:hypothetical protein
MIGGRTVETITPTGANGNEIVTAEGKMNPSKVKESVVLLTDGRFGLVTKVDPICTLKKFKKFEPAHGYPAGSSIIAVSPPLLAPLLRSIELSS